MESNPSSQTVTLTKPDPNPKASRDFLLHVESYLARRDGVDKLLKITRYASKLLLSSAAVPTTHPLHPRLTSFDSSVGLSRKAFRLGKFIQDINSFRSATVQTKHHFALALLAYGGEGIYYFIEQFVWLAKSGLIGMRYSKTLQRASAWAELIGYVGSIGIKVGELKGILRDEACLVSSIEVTVTRGDGVGMLEEKLRKLREKKLMKKMSLVQDLADGLMAVGDIRDGKGRLSGPMLMASAGMVSAVISAHKNWVSC